MSATSCSLNPSLSLSRSEKIRPAETSPHMYRCDVKFPRFEAARLSSCANEASSLCPRAERKLALNSMQSPRAEMPLMNAAVTAVNVSVALGPSATAWKTTEHRLSPRPVFQPFHYDSVEKPKKWSKHAPNAQENNPKFLPTKQNLATDVNMANHTSKTNFL